MTAAIWSTPPDDAALDFPASTLIRFMHNHHLMTILDRPQWLTVRGGRWAFPYASRGVADDIVHSKQYVDTILAKLPSSQYHQGSAVVSVSQLGQKYTIRTADGQSYGGFDHVVLASHADQSLRILRAGEGGATKDEERVLSNFIFSKNKAVLHSDLSVRCLPTCNSAILIGGAQLMPIRRPAWAAWNFISRSNDKGQVNEVALYVICSSRLSNGDRGSRTGPIG